MLLVYQACRTSDRQGKKFPRPPPPKAQKKTRFVFDQRDSGRQSRTCGQAGGILVDCILGCRKERARQHVRRIRRAKIPQLAQGLGRGYPSETFSLLVSPMSEVTRIRSAIEQGDPHAAAQRLPLV